MSRANEPCSACPWVQKGQPDITDALREAAKAGSWFCCHVHCGDCIGAANFAQSRNNIRAELAKAKP